MKRVNHTKYILLLAGMLALNFVAAQNGPVETNSNVLKADSRIQLHQLKKFTYLLTDSTNSLTIHDIDSPIYANGFTLLPDSIEALTKYTYWLKFSIKAIGDIDKWWIVNSTASHGYVDAWIVDESNKVLTHNRTGLFVPRSQKTVKEITALNRFLFSAKNDETRTVYIKLSNEYDAVENITPFELRNPEVGISWETSNFMSVISGAVFVFSILSFFFYFFMKEKAYLFFGLYTLTVCLHYLILHPDMPFVNWFIPEHPRLALPAFYFLAISGWIFFVLFGKFLIDLPALSKRLNKILNWAIGIWVVVLLTTVSLMAVTGRPILMDINMGFGFLFIIYLVRISFFKSVLVRFYVIGALWLVFFSILGVLGIDFSFMNPFPIGQLGQILIYAAGLAYKMKMNEKARAEAQIVRIRNAELSKALEDLKAAQTQLVQSEKMASLGELTAGIAHEIQNPLNFVNNFSEVNTELIDELKGELVTGNVQHANEIADDIKENEGKILHHGKRADAIVKSMLQHSRTTDGQKEPTDINALCDEYLRLAYHGIRARDNSFNTNYETNFDPSIGKINVIPQDLGRVLLNLINNAFYAVVEKKKENNSGFEPLVKLSTQQNKKSIIIAVSDNGPGIPAKLLNKIFQPFFTTKKTGEGTGLGLSLSYDIVKAHGGELKVETREGEGTEFIIQLPLSQ